MSQTSPVVGLPEAPAGEQQGELEDAHTARRRLVAAWLGSGTAVAAMVAVSWFLLVRHGSTAPGGDMIGQAAAAEWLRTLPWWDWRGWSDWFFGGQAIGVNYPPLPHAWLRFTHPYHGQMAAVALGLLVLLPWGALCVARAVGFGPRAQRAAVAGVLVVTALAAELHWILAGFHQMPGFFGSWPAMLGAVTGLFCAAWAARCSNPVACGVVAGLIVLLNPTVAPGVAVVCIALLASSGAPFRVSLRWSATAGAAAVAVSAWWFVPFLAGWRRVVRWEIPLREAWDLGGAWSTAVLAGLLIATVWVARGDQRPCRRLAYSAGAGLLVTLLGDLFGYLRPERWLIVPILVAVVAIAGAAGAPSLHRFGPEAANGKPCRRLRSRCRLHCGHEAMGDCAAGPVATRVAATRVGRGRWDCVGRDPAVGPALEPDQGSSVRAVSSCVADRGGSTRPWRCGRSPLRGQPVCREEWRQG